MNKPGIAEHMALVDELALTNGLKVLANEPFWAHFEEFAKKQKERCQNELLHIPASDVARIALLQGEARTWLTILGIRRGAPMKASQISSRLAATRKEKSDGHERHEGQGQVSPG